jgi:hypothetical protein
LKRFAVALAANGISAGWLNGYKGIAETVTKGGGGATERIWKDKAMTKELTVSDGDDLVNNNRYRIVRGPGRLFEGEEFGRHKGVTSQAEEDSFANALTE